MAMAIHKVPSNDWMNRTNENATQSYEKNLFIIMTYDGCICVDHVDNIKTITLRNKYNVNLPII